MISLLLKGGAFAAAGLLIAAAGAPPQAAPAAAQVPAGCMKDTTDDNAERLPGRVLMTLAGPSRQGILAIQDRFTLDDEREFFVADYSDLFSPDSSTTDGQVLAGRYRALILPPGRHGWLFTEGGDLQTGKDGALILTPAAGTESFCRQRPVLLHSGKADEVNTKWVRSLIMVPADLNLLLGSLASSRLAGQSYLPWRAALESISDSARNRVFQPYEIVIERRNRTIFQAIIRSEYGRPLSAPSAAQADRTTQPIFASAENLRTAQATAGMSKLDYLARFQLLLGLLPAAMTELQAIARIENDAERDRRLRAMSAPTQETLVLFAGTAHGIRDDMAAGVIDATEGPWTRMADSLDALVATLDALAAPPTDTGGEGPADTGAAWGFHASPPPAAVCDLSAVVRNIPARQIPVIAGRTMPASGDAQFWFVRLSGSAPVYRLNTTVRLNVDGFRPLHRDMAARIVAGMKHSCSERTHLRETDETVNQFGEIATKAMVRIDQHACTTVKYPCGISLRGTKSCKKTMSTKLYSMTFAVRKRLKTSATSDAVVYQLDSDELPVRLETISSEFGSLATTAGLRGRSSRFTRRGNSLWNVVEIGGNRNLMESVACNIASQLRQ